MSTLNIFDQYQQMENRLTYALGVTLERSSVFQNKFIACFAPQAQLGKKITVTLQLADNSEDSEKGDERLGIPDLALIGEDGQAIIIESKIQAPLMLAQLVSHENRCIRNKLDVQAALALTGRARDADLLAAFGKQACRYKWGHVSWRAIYELSRALYYEDDWIKEFADYMEIFAAEMDDKKMDSDVKVMGFAGIPFGKQRPYDPHVAKRVLRSWTDDLCNDPALLKDIGFNTHTPPDRHKSIMSGRPVWDTIAPGGGEQHTDNYHYTFYIGDDKAGLAATIPNRIFKTLKNFSKEAGYDIFEGNVRAVVNDLQKRGLLKLGAQPYICVVQRRYRTQRIRFSIDGDLEFDLRTVVPQSDDVPGAPKIIYQPEWLRLCYELIANKNGNLQFQIGVRFPYDTSKCTGEKAFSNISKDALRALSPFIASIIRR